MVNGKLINASIVFIAIVLLGVVLKALQSFVRPFVIAVILSFIMMPLIRFSKRYKVPFSVIVAGMVAGFIAIVVIAGFLFSSEVAALSDSPSKIGFESFEAVALDLQAKGFNVEKWIDSDQISSTISSITATIVRAASSMFGELFLVLLFAMFIIPSREVFIRSVSKAISDAKAAKLRSALLEVEKNIRDYLYTKTLISLGTALVSAIIMFFFKVDFIIIFAFLIFILNFIPNIGSFIAVGIVVLSYFFKFGLSLELAWFAGLLILVQVLFGNILEPKIAGNRLNLSPIVILLSLFLWGWIWGIIGMLIAVPLTSILKIVLEHISSTKKFAQFMS